MKLNMMHYIGLAAAALAILYLLNTMSSSASASATKHAPVENFEDDDEGFENMFENDDEEGFEDEKPKKDEVDAVQTPAPAEPAKATEEGFYGGFDRTVSSYAAAGDATGRAAVPSSDHANCYTRDGLNPSDLLPKPSVEASQFLASNPPAPGSPDERNLLQAGHHIGVDTVCQTNKNPNLQLRSDPPIPRCGAQPVFNSSSIPAVQNNRRVLEIGSQLNPAGCSS